MKQRLFALAAAVVMALGLTACGGSGSSEGRTGETFFVYFTAEDQTGASA